jgi:hypothetical protein
MVLGGDIEGFLEVIGGFDRSVMDWGVRGKFTQG